MSPLREAFIKKKKNSKNFFRCFDLSGGQKNFFLQKCPKSGLVSLKKYIVFFVTLGGGVKPDVTFVTFFFFEGVPNWIVLTRL